jgi:ABC-type branched-subunit amino acid transport system substrate-binding protein
MRKTGRHDREEAGADWPRGRKAMRSRALKFAAACAAIGLLPIAHAAAQDAYVVGVTAAMTGPASATQAPVIEMLRIYVDRLNAKGGINGHKINLLVEDDQAEPSKAAANATKLVRQENVILLINSSFSSTFGPVIAESKRGKVPLWFAGAVCPKETHPPKPDPLMFCTTGFDFSIDIPVATKVIKEMSKEPVKLGLIGIPVPISRIGVDNAEKIAASLGMATVDKEFIPPTTADYTPFANKIKAAGANWGYAYAPWPAEAKTFEALRRLGWTGNYMAYGHIQAEDELARIADPSLNVFMANSMFLEGLAVFKEIRDAAAAGKYSFPATYGTEGWLTGLVLEQILTKTGWPANAEKVTAAMSTLNLDTKGIRGGPLVWTAENHLRTKQYYRFYHYDADKKAVVRLRDWIEVDVKD